MKFQKPEPLKFGLLAHPTKGSLSPVIFNGAFEKFGINAKYDLFDVEPSKLGKFMRGILSKKRNTTEPIRGLSVSAPHKVKIMKFLDKISPEAKKIGAVNSILNINGKLHGFNTDHYGATMALKEACPRLFASNPPKLSAEKIVIIGAGGAARAVAYGLLRNGATRKNITVVNRTLAHAKDVGTAFGVNYCKLSDIPKTSFDILINTASKLESSTLRLLGFSSGAVSDAVVMDIVYKPSLMTPLLIAAKKAGCKIITGENMLLWQAVGQFQVWFE